MQGASGQLILNVSLQEKATFDNYFVESNLEAFSALFGFLETDSGIHQIYLWGSESTGKSHLQQALCHQAADLDMTAVYLSVSEHIQPNPKMLESMENLDLVCIDDLDTIIGNPEWELALFHFINRSHDSGQKLVLASRTNPLALDVSLPDLGSRLIAGPVYHLNELSDSQKQHALRKYASSRGFDIPDDACAYLLINYRRDMGSLMDMLDRLDVLSLRDKKRISVAYIRKVLRADLDG